VGYSGSPTQERLICFQLVTLCAAFFKDSHRAAWNGRRGKGSGGDVEKIFQVLVGSFTSYQGFLDTAQTDSRL
jgi:hypothetical protein